MLKHVTFTALSTAKNRFFTEHFITSYFRPVNIAKFLKMGFFIEHLQKQSFADIP